MFLNRIAVRVLLVLAAGVLPISVAAQNFVTPTIAPTPGINTTGQFTVVNSALGADYTSPHISGDLVCYANSNPGGFTVHYFNLTSGVDAQIPNPDTTQNQDFLCDVRGSVVAFTRSTASNNTGAINGAISTIMTFDTSTGGQPMAVSPSTVFARESAIGDATIVWQQTNSSQTPSDIFAFDRSNGTSQQLDPATTGLFNLDPNISPDGMVAVWRNSASPLAPTAIWKATLANGMWTAEQLQSQVQGNHLSPDTDGNIIAYSSVFVVNGVNGPHVTWQPVNAGAGQVTEQVLAAGTTSANPAISRGYMAFDLELPVNVYNDIAVYDVANNVLYNVTADLAKAGFITGGTDAQLTDISVTADGKLRVVWQDGAGDAIYGYTFYVGSNLVIQKTAPATEPAGSDIPYTITVTNKGPQDATSVTVSDSLPAGETFVSCTPPSGGTCSGTSTVSINLGPIASGTSTTATLVVTTSPDLPPGFAVTNAVILSAAGFDTNPNNTATATTTLTASTASITNMIGQLLASGCIDNSGIANALTNKLAAAQGFISAGDNLDAINALTALLNQIRAQSGKHIATSCTIGGTTFNPATLLINDVQSLINGLRVGSIADPITGYVTNSSGAGLQNAIVSILNGTMSVATAVTDVTGFYYFPTTNVLATNTSYTIELSPIPSPFTTSTPRASTFTWGGSGLSFNFSLN